MSVSTKLFSLPHFGVCTFDENALTVSARLSALAVHPFLVMFMDLIALDLGGDCMEP